MHDACTAPAHDCSTDASAVTRLDPLETLLQPPTSSPLAIDGDDFGQSPLSLLPIPTPCESFRHSGWAYARARVYHALVRTTQPASRLRRFAECGNDCWVLKSLTEVGKYGLACNACNDRFCVPCAQTRARVVNHNLATRLGKEPMRFLTLTIRSVDLTLSEALDKLYTAFRGLQRRKLWTRAVKAGVAFLEVKRSADGQRWHPHLHVLTTGRFLPKVELQTAWRELTGDSFVVDIRFVRAIAIVQHYVAKYAGKPLPSDVMHQVEWLDEAVVALKGRRLILPFGDWHGLKLTERPKTDEWEVVGSLHVLGLRASRGDAEAESIVRLLLKGQADAFLARVRAMSPAAAESQPPPVDQLTFFFGPEDWSVACRRS